MCSRCVFRQVNEAVFTCKVCEKRHHCGSEVCDSLYYNDDHTIVCGLTGLCFGQRVCDTNVDASRGIANAPDVGYTHRVKRSQQSKNSRIDVSFVTQICDKVDYYHRLTDRQKRDLLNKILRLWAEFVDLASANGMYIHRKDSRCFIAAILFGINEGLSCASGYIVKPHSFIQIERLNKKQDYVAFKVSDIRAGQKLIKTVFDNHGTIQPLTLS